MLLYELINSGMMSVLTTSRSLAGLEARSVKRLKQRSGKYVGTIAFDRLLYMDNLCVNYTERKFGYVAFLLEILKLNGVCKILRVLVDWPNFKIVVFEVDAIKY